MARIRRMLLCCSLSGAPIFSPCPGPHPPVAHILAHSTNSPPLSEPHPPYISPSLRSFSPTLPLSHFSCLRTIKLTCQRARAVERACSRGFRGGAVQDWKIHAGCVGVARTSVSRQLDLCNTNRRNHTTTARLAIARRWKGSSACVSRCMRQLLPNSRSNPLHSPSERHGESIARTSALH